MVALKDDFGEASEAAVDLTTASTAVFNLRGPSPGTALVLRRSPCNLSTTRIDGVVTYNWGTAGTAILGTAGTYQGEVEIGWNDGKPETFPNSVESGDDASAYWTIIVTDDLG